MFRLKNFPLKFMISFYLLIGSYLICDWAWIGLRINTSESLPFHAFASTPLKEIQRDLYVSLHHPLNSIKLAKKIVGIPGDEIKIDHQHVYLNGKNYGMILDKTRSGTSIHPISEGLIPEGFVFVHASHPQSFDSRYKEFGLIRVDQIIEVLWPIF